MTLLPKEGDLSNLGNWRPISLINTDVKVFTRLINDRIKHHLERCISPFQTGFMPERFIADNGLILSLVRENTRSTTSSAIGLMLDQEKAYDRVHPLYLKHVLLRFGFPDSLVASLSGLVFDTHIQVNVNGHLSASVLQGRGLRQRVHLSPVLFNLALEPLLRTLMADSSFHGYHFQRPSSCMVPVISPPPFKLLAYADDVLVSLRSPSDLDRLMQHLDTYARASNARLNRHNTQAFSLSGHPSLLGHLTSLAGRSTNGTTTLRLLLCSILAFRSHPRSHNVHSFLIRFYRSFAQPVRFTASVSYRCAGARRS